MIRLLIVEDSALMRKLLGRIFTDEGDFEIAVARNGVEALEIMETFRPDVVTLDVHMPEMDGLACLNRIMLEYPCPVVMVSSLTEAGAQETLAALELGAVDFIAKPGGAISLSIDTVTSRLVEKVRTAATVRVRRSHRLAERVRLKGKPQLPARRTQKSSPSPQISLRNSDGLVLIGTSTGGPPALDAVLSQLPADFPWPVVVAQHMPASFTGPLSRRLNRICEINVQEVTSDAKLEAGNVYIAKGDADIIISSRAGKLIAMAAPIDPERLWHPSVDRLVRSALKHVPAASLVGVLMTGMGSDGAAAMAGLKAAGGLTIAESEETAVVWGMPGELVRQEGASEILSVDRIGARLRELLT